MKKNRSSRMLSLLLVLVMVLGMIPGALAANTQTGQYTDVPAGYWAADAIQYVTEQGLFQGVGGGRFDPEKTMTRGMLVTILHRLVGSPAGGSHSFSDVSKDAWYNKAVSWAATNGVMNGDDKGFSPNVNITMQTLAVALYNYSDADKPTADKLSSFSDAAEVADWAKDQMNWAVSTGLYPIKDGTKLDPDKDLTRAEVAVVLQRYTKIWQPPVSVKGMTALWTPYPSVVALVLEYSENVVAPKAEDFTITDYENAFYNGAEERCDSVEAKITAVYTNSVPELRAMQNSVEGKYVIIEIDDSKELTYDKDQDMWLAHFAGLSNVRYGKDMKAGITTNASMIRFDYSNYVVKQNVDVVNANGKVVNPAGILPAMKAEEITDLSGVDEFVAVDFTSSRGNKVYGDLYVPEDYDASRAYPMVVECSGGSQRLEFDENGNPINARTNVTRDTGAVGWLRVTDDVIILSVQPQKNPANKDTYDEYEDTYELIQNVRGQYNVDSNRIYAMGSSYGTLHLSTVIANHPDLFTVYVQCNGNFVGAQNMYVDEADVTSADYTDESLIKPDSEYYNEYKAALQGVVDNEVKIVVCHGKDDATAPITRGVTTYKMLVRMYKEEGKTDAEIDDLVKLNVYSSEEMRAIGLFKYHDAMRYASQDVDLMTWVLEQSKDSKAEINLLKNLPRAEDMVLTLDDYTGQMIEGYYNFTCPVSEGVNRSAKFYIPANTVYNQPTVFIAVPNDVDTWDFFVQSGWKALADKEVFHVVLMEPANGKWGNTADEVAYIDALVDDVGKRPFFCSFESNFYAVGYGEAADILQNHSVDNPKRWAGIAVLGASGLSADKVKELQSTPSKVKTVMKSEVQTPVWITAASKTADVSRMIDFYKSANHSKDSKDSASKYATEVYLPKTQSGKDVNVDETWCANVVFDAKDWKSCLNETYSANIYNELFKGVYRYPGDSNGALRRPGDINERGFEYYSEKVAGGYNADGSDLYQREWYVYVPDSVDTTKAAPLVFVFHGAGGSCNEIADRSGWAQVADEKGFIIVCPSASHELKVPTRRVTDIVAPDMRLIWNPNDATQTRPSDIKFVEYLYDWMQDHYKIDTTRVYVSGQSSGGSMTWACANYLSHIFAAAAPVSSAGYGDIATGVEFVHPDDAVYTPIINFIGLQDGSFKSGYGDEQGNKTISKWTSFFKTVEQYDSYTYNDGGKKCSSQEGLFTNYVFSNADGVPMLRGVEVTDKTHAIWPSECFKAWDEWFVNYTKDADGNLFYKGVQVK